MNELQELFKQVPLPFEYVVFPKENEQPAEKIPGLFYYVNRVITGLTQKAFRHGGFSRSSSFSKWNASWGRQYEAPEYKKCLSWQKVNHFAGAYLMGRKDDFHQRMCELKKRDPDLAKFYPESYLLPKEEEAFKLAFPKHHTWIFKPAAAARGNGIELLNNEQPMPTKRGIFQVYIERPLLITNRKFDLRLYALVTSVNPIRIYMHKNGMARFATHEYSKEAPLSDLRMHLTNFSMNKNDRNYILTSGKESIQNSKWSLQFFIQYIESQGINSKDLMSRIEKVITAALIAGLTTIREHHFKCIQHRHTSYELYGVDVILDQDLNPYIMEINISPSMEATGSNLDKNIKFPLLIDTLNMARIIKCNSALKDPCPAASLIDSLCNKSLTEERVNDIVNKNKDPWGSPVFADFVCIRDFIEENSYDTKFYRVFPKRKTMKIFSNCFPKKLYFDILFEKWIELPRKKRINILQNSWKVYLEGMNRIKERLEVKENENQEAFDQPD